MCREEGLELSNAASSGKLGGFDLFGVVKEVDVDDEGLQDFHSNFYNFPLYLDESLTIYKGLGERKMGFFGLSKLVFKGVFGSMTSRLKKKKIEGNMIGEGLVQGGVIIFNKDGNPVYSYQEITGDELPIEEILDATSSIRNKDSCPDE